MLIITFGWLVLLPHEEPHPWWPDGEWLPWVGPGLLARPDPLPGCRGRVWWPGLMALDLPTSIFLGTRYQGGGVHMDGCLPTANKKRGPQHFLRWGWTGYLPPCGWAPNRHPGLGRRTSGGQHAQGERRRSTHWWSVPPPHPNFGKPQASHGPYHFESRGSVLRPPTCLLAMGKEGMVWCLAPPPSSNHWLGPASKVSS